jgi:hypothetical protein
VDIEIVCNPAAFKHGVTEADIRHAYRTKVYEAVLADFPDKYALIGFDTKGNPLEILYNPMDSDTINRLVPKPGWFLHKSCGFSG